MNLNATVLQRSFLIVLALLGGQMSWGQATHRPGSSAPTAKTQSEVVNLPCGGTELFVEDFESGIPGTWTILDIDGNTPDSTTGLNPGWQVRTDYRDANNQVAVSSSFYNPVGASEDWLITPLVATGNNPCLSWTAYSQDVSFKEDYEVLLSTTGTATTDFTEVLDTVFAEESVFPATRAIYLSNYVNDTVYLAFRQISNDKFVLALDDVKLTNAAQVDAGITQINFGSPQLGDTSKFQFFVGNFGSEALTSFEVCWQIDGGTINCTTLDTIAQAPNLVSAFVHPDSFAFDSLPAFYTLCAWTQQPNGQADGFTSNDTLCVQVPIGDPVSVLPGRSQDFQLTAFPNPVTEGRLQIRFDDVQGVQNFSLGLYDLQGRLVRQSTALAQTGFVHELNVAELNAGLYLMVVTNSKGESLTRKIQLN